MAHGRYTIVGKLADGGMAEIFLATQHGAEGFEKTVVLKRVLTAFSADPQFRNMFLDEAHISMSLAHGNIVQVLDVGVAGERTFLVLELVEGWDLDQVMERAQATGPDHPWPPSLALYVTAQICRGLAYAHAKRGADGRSLGIVHRDVSPNNVLISEQGEVKLADFGIAKAEKKRERTAAGVIKGKIGFMSPEQALGRSLDARADLFSVGAVLYLMLTGRRPFDAGSELESLMLAQRAEYRPPEDLNPYLSPDATAIVNRAMRLDVAARYQTADQMLIDVERVLRGQYHSAGQTELKQWLGELARRDGVAPIGRVRFAPDQAAPHELVDPEGELSAGVSVELSDFDGSAAPTAVSIPVPAARSGLAGEQISFAPSVEVLPQASRRPTPGGPAAGSGSGSSASQPRLDAVAPGVHTARTMTNRRLPRRSRVGLGFVLGAICMLGAVFGIKWLAEWAGRERAGISRWMQPADDSALGGSARSSAATTPVALGDSGAIPPPAPPGSPVGAARVGVAEPIAAAATDAGHAEAVAIAKFSGLDAGIAAVAAAGAGEPDDDEAHLLGRVVPDAATVIGEDEAEDNPADKKRGDPNARNTKQSDAGRITSPDMNSAKPGNRASRAAETEKGRTKGSPRPAPTPSTHAQPVQIRITTSPLGAVVRTKKQVLGRTPLAIRFNPGNTYELTFVKSGYVTNRRRLTVAVGKPQSISVAMKKAAPPRRGLFRGR